MAAALAGRSGPSPLSISYTADMEVVTGKSKLLGPAIHRNVAHSLRKLSLTTDLDQLDT